MIIIGGLGSIMGTLMGTAFMVLLPESMEWLSHALRGSPIDQFLGLKNNIAFLREMAIGIIIIVFLVFEPDGLRIAGGRSRRTGNSTRSRIEVGTGRTTIEDLEKQPEDYVHDDEDSTEHRLAGALRAGGTAAASQPDLAGASRRLFGRHLGRRNGSDRVADTYAWINKNGGINGKQVNVDTVDYGYQVPRAIAQYKKWSGADGRRHSRLGHRRHRSADRLPRRGQDPGYFGILCRSPLRPDRRRRQGQARALQLLLRPGATPTRFAAC